MCTFTHVTQLRCNSNRWSGPYVLLQRVQVYVVKYFLLSEQHLLCCSPSCSFSTLFVLIIS